MIKTIIKIIRIIKWIKRKRPLLKETQELEKEGKIKERNEIVHELVTSWGKNVANTLGADITVKGAENIPQNQSVIFVANHQGYADIISILGFINKPTAFISKIELSKINYIFGWMEQMQCIFLDRNNPRQSVAAMHNAVETVKKGYSLVIFPEGTRSRGAPIRKFKTGSFKLAFNSEAPIVPITIDGTWRLFEEHNRIRPAKVTLTVHPPVYTKGLSREEQHKIPEQVQKTIEKALPKTALRSPKEIAKLEKKYLKKLKKRK